MSGSDSNSPDKAVTNRDLRLIARSKVPVRAKYLEYRQELRYDFFYSCAYCTMSEFEAQSIRMTIDHYEPRNARPDLENDYGNLMYACSLCNERKSDRCPPPESRNDGRRFFRPDSDVREEHFTREDIVLEPLSKVGEFSIAMLDLNRAVLLRLRKIRKRIAECDPLVSGGILALRTFHIDQLPPKIRSRAARAIAKVNDMATAMGDELDAVLRASAKSELLDPDPNAEERAKHRETYMNGIQALYPVQTFRAPRKKRS
jgi:hypothetical protein